MDHPRRPNRTAASRREQYERSQARTLSHVLTSFSYLQTHRGNRPTRLYSALNQALLSEQGLPDHSHQSSSAFSEHLETRISYLESSLANVLSTLQDFRLEVTQGLHAVRTNLLHLDSNVAAATATSNVHFDSEEVKLEDLVDSATMDRIRAVQQERNRPTSCGVWYACEEANCSYVIFDNDKNRAQKKYQHVQGHKRRQTSSVVTSASQPISRIHGKTASDRIRFKSDVDVTPVGPLPTSEADDPDTVPSFSSAAASSTDSDMVRRRLRGKQAPPSVVPTAPEPESEDPPPDSSYDDGVVEPINVEVKNMQREGASTIYQIRPTSMLRKVFSAACSRAGLDPSQSMLCKSASLPPLDLDLSLQQLDISDGATLYLWHLHLQ